jgi:hypothetical protein
MINKKQEMEDFATNEHERVLVELDNADELTPQLKLLQQHWASGVGWFTQKTIVLPLTQAWELREQLDQTLAQTRLKFPAVLLNSQSSTFVKTPALEAAPIIDFASRRTTKPVPNSNHAKEKSTTHTSTGL